MQSVCKEECIKIWKQTQCYFKCCVCLSCLAIHAFTLSPMFDATHWRICLLTMEMDSWIFHFSSSAVCRLYVYTLSFKNPKMVPQVSRNSLLTEGFMQHLPDWICYSPNKDTKLLSINSTWSCSAVTFGLKKMESFIVSWETPHHTQTFQDCNEFSWNVWQDTKQKLQR